ncbi:outer membrane beta-barrel protein [Flavobacterium luteum]|uniref:PorT family protein n=1 Tax=Flavobacterium luteum TaxID=2026654 RepID=A0A7J5AH45_9FLAO|nr:outer membrane beta-barrel protein [Flavobacterium luteum]KAB1156855.1 PorT family protein [Flavobacterium luteum]
MRKVIFIFCLSYSLFSIAQDKIKFGINTGVTYSNIRGNEIADKNKYDFDFLLGTSFELPINNKMSFFTGLNYERKSFKRKILFEENLIEFDPFDPAFSQDAGFTAKATLSYLSIPLNIKYYLGRKNSFFLNGGLNTAIFLNLNSNIGNEKNGIKTFDFGFNLGFGKKIKLNEKTNLNIEIKDSYGLVNISSIPVYNNGTVKTNSVNLILNWEFKI